MRAGDLVGAALLCAALVGVLVVLLRGMRPQQARWDAGKRPSLARYAERGTFVPGFVSTLAVVTFADVVGTTGAATVTIAALLAVGFATVGRVPACAAAASAVCGGLGSVAAVIDFFRTTRCTGDSPVFTTTVLALAIVLCATAAVATSVLAGRPLAMRPLAVFGALEVLAFLTQPLGVPILKTVSPGGATLVLVVASILFGVLVGVAPVLAVSLGGVAGGFTAVYGEAAWGTMCDARDAGALASLVVFVVVFVLVGVVRSLARR